MTKTVTNIPVPPEWESTNDWDSHKSALWLALKNTEGKVIELGSGDGSTKSMSGYCIKNERVFLSFENNLEWAKKTNANYFPDLLNIDTKECGFIFIDCAPGEIRKDLINKWRNDAKVIVVHDTEVGAEYVYGMSEVLSTFKYRLDYQPVGKPHTTAVSNTIDVTKWVD